jgi:hypothetical protein
MWRRGLEVHVPTYCLTEIKRVACHKGHEGSKSCTRTPCGAPGRVQRLGPNLYCFQTYVSVIWVYLEVFDLPPSARSQRATIGGLRDTACG